MKLTFGRVFGVVNPLVASSFAGQEIVNVGQGYVCVVKY
jgi:hypothetical protein